LLPTNEENLVRQQPCTVQQAVEHAHWFARYALDRLEDGRYHPGLRSHLIAARVQLDAAAELAQPEPDQEAGVTASNDAW
jgi:hypothetical protein